MSVKRTDLREELRRGFFITLYKTGDYILFGCVILREVTRVTMTRKGIEACS
jgi:hypothetical protein